MGDARAAGLDEQGAEQRHAVAYCCCECVVRRYRLALLGVLVENVSGDAAALTDVCAKHGYLLQMLVRYGGVSVVDQQSAAQVDCGGWHSWATCLEMDPHAVRE